MFYGCIVMNPRHKLESLLPVIDPVVGRLPTSPRRTKGRFWWETSEKDSLYFIDSKTHTLLFLKLSGFSQSLSDGCYGVIVVPHVCANDLKTYHSWLLVRSRKCQNWNLQNGPSWDNSGDSVRRLLSRQCSWGHRGWWTQTGKALNWKVI